MARHDIDSLRPNGVGPYQLFMLVLCIWALTTLGADAVFHFDPEIHAIIEYADNAICFLFLLDFLNSFARADRKLHYLLTWGWIDLLSSIPTVDAFRLGRTARVMRVLRVLRGVKSARLLAHYVAARRAESAFFASVLMTILLLVCCSIAILHFEVPVGGNIASAQDAMWWAISTMTTVGYGDRYPISAEGRLVAVFLMAAGVGVFGTLSGLAASWFLSPSHAEADSDLTDMKTTLANIERRLHEDRTPVSIT